MLLLFFPSNAFMAFARSLHTFNCSKKMNCEVKALWRCYSCCTDRLRPGMDPLAPWTVKESAYCALRQGSARAVSSACTISSSWSSTAMVSGGTVGEPPPLHLWVAEPRSGSSTRLPNLSWSSVAASAGGCWDQLWPARLKGKAGILTRILERDASVSGCVRLHVMVLQHCHCQEYWYGRPEGRAMSSSVLVMEFINLSCIFSIQCFHHLMVLCCCWILQRAYSHIIG